MLAQVTPNMPKALRNEKPRRWTATFSHGHTEDVLVSDPGDGRYGSWEEALESAKEYIASRNMRGYMTGLVMSVDE